MAALALAAKMKGRTSATISRELALAMSSSSFLPRFREHMLGVMNAAADALSRLMDPSGKFEVPAVLQGVRRDRVPLRDEQYYITPRPL